MISINEHYKGLLKALPFLKKKKKKLLPSAKYRSEFSQL